MKHSFTSTGDWDFGFEEDGPRPSTIYLVDEILLLYPFAFLYYIGILPCRKSSASKVQAKQAA
jgi:hypothetical protein